MDLPWEKFDPEKYSIDDWLENFKAAAEEVAGASYSEQVLRISILGFLPDDIKYTIRTERWNSIVDGVGDWNSIVSYLVNVYGSKAEFLSIDAIVSQFYNETTSPYGVKNSLDQIYHQTKLRPDFLPVTVNRAILFQSKKLNTEIAKLICQQMEFWLQSSSRITLEEEVPDPVDPTKKVKELRVLIKYLHEGCPTTRGFMDLLVMEAVNVAKQRPGKNLPSFVDPAAKAIKLVEEKNPIEARVDELCVRLKDLTLNTAERQSILAEIATLSQPEYRIRTKVDEILANPEISVERKRNALETQSKIKGSASEYLDWIEALKSEDRNQVSKAYGNLTKLLKSEAAQPVSLEKPF